MSPETLYQFEPRLRAAAVAALKARGHPFVYDALDLTQDQTTPEAEPPIVNNLVVEASGFTRASNHMDFAKNGRPFFNHYNGQLRYIIQTKRDAAGTAAHTRYLGAVRSLARKHRQRHLCERRRARSQ
jgi:hypothetical protein